MSSLSKSIDSINTGKKFFIFNAVIKRIKGFTAVLRSNVHNPDLMYVDDFHGFLMDPKEQILHRIEKAMRKKILHYQQVPEEGYGTLFDQQ